MASNGIKWLRNIWRNHPLTSWAGRGGLSSHVAAGLVPARGKQNGKNRWRFFTVNVEIIRVPFKWITSSYEKHVINMMFLSTSVDMIISFYTSTWSLEVFCSRDECIWMPWFSFRSSTGSPNLPPKPGNFPWLEDPGRRACGRACQLWRQDGCWDDQFERETFPVHCPGLHLGWAAPRLVDRLPKSGARWRFNVELTLWSSRSPWVNKGSLGRWPWRLSMCQWISRLFGCIWRAWMWTPSFVCCEEWHRSITFRGIRGISGVRGIIARASEQLCRSCLTASRVWLGIWALGSASSNLPPWLLPFPKIFESLEALSLGVALKSTAFFPAQLKEASISRRSTVGAVVRLPRFLKSLTFGDGFNQCLSQCLDVNLPQSLQCLTLGNAFNHLLNDINLPSGLQNLTFGRSFNQSPEDILLPANLQRLSFGDSFNKSLEQVRLPDSLRFLSFGHFFNQSLAKVEFPESLQSLILGDNFNQSLNVKLPSRLRSLTFGYFFRQPLDAQLPNSLEELNCGFFFLQGELWHQSSLLNLQALTLCRNLEVRDRLPARLKSLTLSGRFNQNLHEVNLPAALESLTLGNQFNQSLDAVIWPSGLQSLTFGKNFNQALANLPRSLVTLIFGKSFNRSLDLMDLNRLQSLTFGEHFNRFEHLKLPQSLRTWSSGMDVAKGSRGVGPGGEIFQQPDTERPGHLKLLTCGDWSVG